MFPCIIPLFKPTLVLCRNFPLGQSHFSGISFYCTCCMAKSHQTRIIPPKLLNCNWPCYWNVANVNMFGNYLIKSLVSRAHFTVSRRYKICRRYNSIPWTFKFNATIQIIEQYIGVKRATTNYPTKVAVWWQPEPFLAVKNLKMHRTQKHFLRNFLHLKFSIEILSVQRVGHNRMPWNYFNRKRVLLFSHSESMCRVDCIYAYILCVLCVRRRRQQHRPKMFGT